MGEKIYPSPTEVERAIKDVQSVPTIAQAKTRIDELIEHLEEAKKHEWSAKKAHLRTLTDYRSFLGSLQAEILTS